MREPLASATRARRKLYKSKNMRRSIVPEHHRENLLESRQIRNQLKGLDKGGYARTYRKDGKAYRTSLHVMVARFLDSLGSKYEVDAPIFPGSKLVADFLVDGRTVIFVGQEISPLHRKAIANSGRRCIVV